jgi:hypothetical protein
MCRGLGPPRLRNWKDILRPIESERRRVIQYCLCSEISHRYSFLLLVKGKAEIPSTGLCLSSILYGRQPGDVSPKSAGRSLVPVRCHPRSRRAAGTNALERIRATRCPRGRKAFAHFGEWTLAVRWCGCLLGPREAGAGCLWSAEATLPCSSAGGYSRYGRRIRASETPFASLSQALVLRKWWLVQVRETVV